MDDIQDLPSLRNVAPSRAQFTFQSSDPIALDLTAEPQVGASGANRKRAATPFLGPRKQPRNQNQTPQSVILEARDLIVLASTLTKDRQEQTRLLDLLAIFREYTEKGSLFKASTIITSQIANLESATRQIQTTTRSLIQAKPATPITSSKPTASNSQPTSQKPSYANIAKTSQPTGSQEWTKIGPKGPIKPQTPGPPKPRKEDRITLIQETPLPDGRNPNFSPLAIRNAFNSAFKSKGIKEPVVATISRSLTGNIVVTTTPNFNADFLLEKSSIWEGILPYKRIQKQQEWHKVAIHRIPIFDFNDESGMARIVDEIKTFNKGFTPIGTPYWLTSASNRQSQINGSIIVAFPTADQASKAIKNGLKIAGITATVLKFHPTSNTAQCTKCGGFGHLHTLCKKKGYKCLLCSENHATEQHHCPICKNKGKRCLHLIPKCISCQGPHTSTEHAKCEFYQALKKPVQRRQHVPDTQATFSHIEVPATPSRPANIRD